MSFLGMSLWRESEMIVINSGFQYCSLKDDCLRFDELGIELYKMEMLVPWPFMKKFGLGDSNGITKDIPSDKKSD